MQPIDVSSSLQKTIAYSDCSLGVSNDCLNKQIVILFDSLSKRYMWIGAMNHEVDLLLGKNVIT